MASDARIRWNLRLLATLTAVFSVPDLVQGVLTWTHSAPGGGRLYGAYIVALGLLELAGALLLAVRVRGGRWLILAAAAGFYLEAALGLAGLQRSLLAAAIFAMCVPAEAWVIWFLCHPSVRTYLAAGRERPQRRCLTASP